MIERRLKTHEQVSRGKNCIFSAKKIYQLFIFSKKAKRTIPQGRTVVVNGRSSFSPGMTEIKEIWTVPDGSGTLNQYSKSVWGVGSILLAYNWWVWSRISNDLAVAGSAFHVQRTFLSLSWKLRHSSSEITEFSVEESLWVFHVWHRILVELQLH